VVRLSAPIESINGALIRRVLEIDTQNNAVLEVDRHAVVLSARTFPGQRYSFNTHIEVPRLVIVSAFHG